MSGQPSAPAGPTRGMRLRFLGTGASGGTPGRGRSARAESSLLVEGPARLLIDASRHFREQSQELPELDGVLLTHAHRDATPPHEDLRREVEALCPRAAPTWDGLVVNA